LLNLDLCGRKGAPLKLLCLGAHSDDIEIGCGATVLALLEKYSEAEVQWVVFSGEGVRAQEAIDSADLFLSRAGKKQVRVWTYRDSYFPAQWQEIKQSFNELKSFAPDLVLTHYREDLHQDHRVISDLTWNAFRDQLILEYEVPKWDGDLGRPNFYVPVDQRLCRMKVDNLIAAFKSQAGKHWFDQETFFSLLRIRGLEVNARDRYAEAFYARKMSFDSSMVCPADE
jgi:LmbE family N-acetylglucosaminyl deacetylase